MPFAHPTGKQDTALQLQESKRQGEGSGCAKAALTRGHTLHPAGPRPLNYSSFDGFGRGTHHLHHAAAHLTRNTLFLSFL